MKLRKMDALAPFALLVFVYLLLRTGKSATVAPPRVLHEGISVVTNKVGDIIEVSEDEEEMKNIEAGRYEVVAVAKVPESSGFFGLNLFSPAVELRRLP